MVSILFDMREVCGDRKLLLSAGIKEISAKHFSLRVGSSRRSTGALYFCICTGSGFSIQEMACGAGTQFIWETRRELFYTYEHDKRLDL